MVPSTIRILGLFVEGRSTPFSAINCTQSLRNQGSQLRKRFSRDTSETSAHSANFARNAVSRNEKPLPTCSNKVRNSISAEENPRNLSTAPVRPASSLQPFGNKPLSTSQSSSAAFS